MIFIIIRIVRLKTSDSINLTLINLRRKINRIKELSYTIERNNDIPLENWATGLPFI